MWCVKNSYFNITGLCGYRWMILHLKVVVKGDYFRWQLFVEKDEKGTGRLQDDRFWSSCREVGAKGNSVIGGGLQGKSRQEADDLTSSFRYFVVRPEFGVGSAQDYTHACFDPSCTSRTHKHVLYARSCLHTQ